MLWYNSFPVVCGRALCSCDLCSSSTSFFSQPCRKELVVLIHFHLKNPIMVGKKKAVDIQFFAEVIRGSVAIHSKSNMYDPEELDEERRERKLRKRLNDMFKSFVEKCEKLVEQVRSMVCTLVTVELAQLICVASHLRHLCVCRLERKNSRSTVRSETLASMVCRTKQHVC